MTNPKRWNSLYNRIQFAAQEWGRRYSASLRILRCAPALRQIRDHAVREICATGGADEEKEREHGAHKKQDT